MMSLLDGGRRDVARGARAMSAGSLGWVEAIKGIQICSAAGDGVLLPASPTEIAAPQDAKLSARVPEPSEQL